MLRQELSNLSAHLVTPGDSTSHAGMIAFKSVDEHKLVSALDHDQVIVSSRDGNVRISPHFYNNEGDVEALMKSLFDHKGLLVSSSVS
jgi:selenocysteine lyase/cysteine desulfurase